VENIRGYLCLADWQFLLSFEDCNLGNPSKVERHMSAERILKVEFHWNSICSLKSKQQNMKFIHEESIVKLILC